VNATNPFQLPAWSEINREQRRRARFKKTVISIIAAIVLLLIGLLIEGCRTEREALATPTTSPSLAQTVSATPQTTIASGADPEPAAGSPAEPPTPSQAMPTVTKANTVPDPGRAGTVYVVKSGDTLTRIARTYGTSIQAIEAANGLTDDRILVGAKLKIPTA